jgi:hypothetical protein
MLMWSGVEMTDNETIPQAVRDEITEARGDIDFIHWDEAHFEDELGEWVVPVEAYFTKADADIDLGWNYGNMRVELNHPDGIDYYVGDWTVGMHPDMHTFER